MFENIEQTLFSGWPAGSSLVHLKGRWKSPGFRRRLNGSEGEWSGMLLQFLCTSNRRLSQGMPSEIVSASCELVPGTVRNVIHTVSQLFCVCMKQRERMRVRMRKSGNIQECGFRSIIQHYVWERLLYIYVTSLAAYLRDSLSSTGIETTHTSHITY